MAVKEVFDIGRLVYVLMPQCFQYEVYDQVLDLLCLRRNFSLVEGALEKLPSNGSASSKLKVSLNDSVLYRTYLAIF